jgi:hypothetical protein
VKVRGSGKMMYLQPNILLLVLLPLIRIHDAFPVRFFQTNDAL